ncbi:hypothetical protein BN132_2552 [Cronobacter turicensis 564]|nr:hypothetical protein BN132_2552 [Cronobacter turicensis 564]
MLHSGHRRAGAGAAGVLALNFIGRRAVVAHQTFRAIFPACRRESGERCHGVVAAADIPFIEIGRRGAVIAVPLDIDLFHAAAIDKIVHVGPAPGAGEGVGNVTQRKPQRYGFVVVDIHLQLRHLRQIVGAYGMQGSILIRFADELVTHLQQRVAVGAAAGHQFEGKTVALTQAFYGRWRHSKDSSITEGTQFPAGTQGNRLSGVLIAFTLGPVFQGDKRHPGILAAAAKAKALDGENHVGIGFLFVEEPLANLTADFRRTYRRRAGWQGVLHHDFTLILRWQKTAGQFQHRNAHRAAEQGVDHQHATGATQGAQHLILIAMLSLAVEAVKRAEEPFFVRGRMAQH